MKPLPRWIPCSSAVLQLLIGGMRFSDGRSLLAIAKGEGIEAAIFQNPASHYVWESPLKVWLLRSWPFESLVGIAALFLLIGILPVAGLMWPKKSRFYALTSWLLILTPAFKISLQNLGVGDSLISLLTLLIILNKAKPLLASGFLFPLALWHPGQAPFITASILVGWLFLPQAETRAKSWWPPLWVLAIAMASALIAARAALWAHNATLGFEYTDRLGYMKLRIAEFLPGNIIHAPLGLFFPACLAIVVIKLGSTTLTRKRKAAILAWITLVSGITLLTTDVSRVAIMCLTPLALLTAESIASGESTLSPESRSSGFTAIPPWAINRWPIACLLIASLVPLYSWSGVDFTLWPDLLADACKYGVYCR